MRLKYVRKERKTMNKTGKLNIYGDARDALTSSDA